MAAPRLAPYLMLLGERPHGAVASVGTPALIRFSQRVCERVCLSPAGDKCPGYGLAARGHR